MSLQTCGSLPAHLTCSMHQCSRLQSKSNALVAIVENTFGSQDGQCQLEANPVLDIWL